VQGLMQTVRMCEHFEIPVTIEFCRNDSLVSRARNNLIAKAMSNTKTTHFMFIDNDITWNPFDVIKLIVCDKALCGGVYPLKHYYWEKLMTKDNKNIVNGWIDKKNNSNLKTLISDEDAIQSNLLKYNINYLSPELTIENNLTKVRHIATGFMMIKRSTIEKMCQAYPSTKYVDDVGFLNGSENDYAYALFDCGVEEGHYFSEDWLFCHRWSKMGGNIYLDVTISLTHTGIEDFKGCYINSIM
jgi:hypothetical protein